MKALLNAGIDIDCKDMHGRTPLSWAAFSRDEHGLTLLSREESNSREAVVRLLLEGGC